MRLTRSERAERLSRLGRTAVSAEVVAEVAVSVEFNGIGYAVMMMTPADLRAFALGFALTERIATSPADLLDVEAVEVDAGIILRITVTAEAAGRLGDRIRHRTSDTGCGLCGIASLESLQRPLPAPPPPRPIDAEAIFAALAHLAESQPLNRATGAVHAAAWCDSGGCVAAIVEDAGRHNALDKLIGKLGGRAPESGFCLVTSRLSFEMVDKALVARMGTLVGISAATTLAIDHARANGLALVALARDDSMLVLNAPDGW